MPSCLTPLLSTVFLLTSVRTNNHVVDDPICPLPSLPFGSESDAYNWKLKVIEECDYEYWKCVNRAKYRGAKGFKKVYGGSGHIYNRSSIAVYDDKVMRGHGPISAKARFARNLVCVDEEFDPLKISLNVSDWGPYSVTYSMKVAYIFTMPAFEGTQLTLTDYVEVKYFEDASGIIERSETFTDEGLFNDVLSNILETTQSLTELLGIDDIDDGEQSLLYKLFGENMNPTMMVFLMVISVLTTCIASVISILFFCVYKKRGKGYGPLSITDADTTDFEYRDSQS